jgi:membrane-associated protease RseP (regulator of RpoE activity)
MVLTRRWGGGIAGWAFSLFFLSFPCQSPQLLPYSALPLDLVGVIVNTAVPVDSVCLIRCLYPLRKAAVFRAGQNSFDFAEVKEIRQNVVIIRNLVTNRLEYLTFAGNKPILKTPSPPPLPAPAISSEGAKISLPKDVVNHYLINFRDLLESAFAAPRYREGKDGQKFIEGFEISRIKEASIVEQVGLKNGDVILEVNGEPLDSLATVMHLLGRVQTLTQTKLTVLRGGQKKSFIFDRK